MADDVRLSRWDLRASAGTTVALEFTSPEALTSLSVYTGGTTTDVDDLTGATQYAGTLSGGNLVATVEVTVPTGNSVALRLVVNGAVQTVGRLVPSTSGTPNPDNTITLSPGEMSFDLTVLGVVADTDSVAQAELHAEETARIAADAALDERLDFMEAASEFTPEAFGAVRDGTTDDTDAVQAAIDACYAAEGGIVRFRAGIYRCDGQLLIPHDNEVPRPQTMSMRLTGAGQDPALIRDSGGTVLDLRYSGADAKIVTLGQGVLTIDNLTMADDGTSSTAFLLTTQTVVKVDSVTFRGNPTKTLTTCDQDAIILGGTTDTRDNTTSSPFTGYGTVISRCAFDRIRTCVLGRVWCNSVVIRDCWVNSRCGSGEANGAAFIIDHGGVGFARGNQIQNNTIEVTGYPYGIRFALGSERNCAAFNSFWDADALTIADVRFDGTGNAAIFAGESSTLSYSEATPGTNKIVRLRAGELLHGWLVKTNKTDVNALVVQAVASQVADILAIKDGSGNRKTYINNQGWLRVDDTQVGTQLPIDMQNNSTGNSTARFYNKAAGRGGIDIGFVPGLRLINNSGTLQATITFGGDPEGSVTAPVGSIHLRTTGGAGTTFYVKESGAGNTGWRGV